AVGIVEKSEIIDGTLIVADDVVLGLASNGAHSNGYSLIRRILDLKRVDLGAPLEGRSLGELILAPTRIYVKPMLSLMKQVDVKGMAHITGGGLIENIPRILPGDLAVHIERGSWPMPPLFTWLKQQGNVSDREMFRVFNCGIGLVVIVSAAQAASALALLEQSGETVWRIGRVRRRRGNGPQTLID
ncbi:MAG TPA: AIR synthase-related protein, partial [Burkholderiales bacterium]|nr:AIR synthase-related protein [Burkholderiales bacterium]